jgi:hypothetical protein
MTRLHLGLRALLIALTLSLAACGSEELDDDCSHQMDDLRDEIGSPQEVTSYNDGDYHGETWFYWRRGFARIFVWKDGAVGSCETRDHTFAPIR